MSYRFFRLVLIALVFLVCSAAMRASGVPTLYAPLNPSWHHSGRLWLHDHHLQPGPNGSAGYLHHYDHRSELIEREPYSQQVAQF